MIYLRSDWNPMFNQLQDAIIWIESQVKFKPKADLSRMYEAVNKLGNPEKSYKIIHVAGTNGKGSVCSYLSNILVNHYKVGTFTSPYIIQFNERIKVNLEMISDADLLIEINEIYDFNVAFQNSYGESLSFFELITLMALKHFKKSGCEVVVLEVGIGGLLDATNVVDSDLAIITSIGFDHMQTLGNTLESIAYNKLGIVKKATPLIAAVDESLTDQFMKHAAEQGSFIHLIKDEDLLILNENPLQFTYEYHTYESGLLGLHQAKNAALAIAAINYLFKKIQIKEIKAGIKKTTWPGRVEIISENPLVILDGAHNTHGVDALVKTMQAYYKDKNIHVLFCAMADKDYKQMLESLSSIAKTMHVTHFDYKRVSALEDLLSHTPHPYKYAHKDAIDAYLHLIEIYKDDVILITGSLYFISLIRAHILKA